MWPRTGWGLRLVGAGMIALTGAAAQAQLAFRLQDCLADRDEDDKLHICSIMSGTEDEKVQGGLIASGILRARGEYETAVDLLNTLGYDVRLQVELGHVWFEAGDMLMSDFHFEMALIEGHEPDEATRTRMVTAAFFYGEDLLYEADDPEGALWAYDRALALDPDHVPTLLDRAEAARRLDRHAEALVSLDRAIALGADWSGYLLRARSRQALGDVAGAIADYRQVLAENPGHSGARAALEALAP